MNVLYGSSSGITAAGDHWWDQGALVGVQQSPDNFGFSLAAGDFNADGEDDLAVGAPGDDVDGEAQAGAVNVILGSTTGLVQAGNEQFTQNDPVDIGGVAENGDQFGSSLVAGSFDCDSDDDLAIGVPWEDVGSETAAGAVNVLYGGASGALGSAANEIIDQNDTSESAEPWDLFGDHLGAGDFNDDGCDDLAIGAPREDRNAADDGLVNVLYGDTLGILAGGQQIWHQNVLNVEGTSASGDQFGTSFSSADFNDDGIVDLVIGVVQDGPSASEQAGGVNVLNGSSGGLVSTNDKYFGQ